MVKRRLAIGVLGHIFPGNNGNVHHAAAARLSIEWRLLSAVPDPAVMNSQVTGSDIEADLACVGVIVDEIFFAEKEPQHSLFVGAGQYPQAAILKRRIVQVDAHIEHRHDLLPQKEIPRAVRMLNVGIHLDDTPFENGGFGYYPAPTNRGMLRLLFGKNISSTITPTHAKSASISLPQ